LNGTTNQDKQSNKIATNQEKDHMGQAGVV
jgi:hypothetical protein